MVVLGAVSVVVIGLLGRAVAGRSVGLVAAALAAVHAGFWVNDGLVMAETLVTLATAGALWATVRYHRAASARLAVELGAWIGMATLARSEALLLVPLLVVPLVWVTHQEVRTRLMRAGVAAGVAGALLLPWVIPNMVRFEEPVLLSTNDGLTLAGANNPQTYSGDAIGFWTIEHAEATVDVSGLDQSEASRVLRDAAVDHATDNVSRWPTVVAARVGRVWSIYRPLQMLDWNKGEGREVWASMLALGGYLALLPAAAFGWWTLRRDGGYTWPFTALIVQVTMVGALFYGLSRFRVTAEIALVVLAAVALSRLMAWRAGTPPQRSRRRQ